MHEAHQPYAALRSRDYRNLLLASLLAGIAGEMQSVAVGWELYVRTGDAAALGFVGLVLFLPVLFLSLPAGHAADRYSRTLLLTASHAARALASLGLAALAFWQGPVPLIYLCLFLSGVGQAFNSPARWGLLPQVVPPADLGNAVTWISSGWQLAAVVGPAAGGFVLYLADGATAGAFLLATVSFFACAFLYALLRPRPGPRPEKEVTLRSLLAGIGFVWRTKAILATITLDLFAVLFGGATALLPIFAKDVLDAGPAGLGWLRAAPAIGAVLMAVVLAHRPPLRRPGVAMLWAVAGFGVATVIFGLSRSLLLSMVVLAAAGALDNISVVVRHTLVQVLTPDEMRGRVSAVNAIFIGSSNELGAFESGLTAKWFGPVISVVGGGIATVAVVAAVLFAWPQVRRLGPLHAVPSPESPGLEGGLAVEEERPPLV